MIDFLFNRFIIFGIGFGLSISFVLHLPGAEDRFAAGFAISLGIIGAIYLGALIVRPVGNRAAVHEILAATLTFVFVAAGSYVNVLWLVPGYLWHGIWDWLHHERQFGNRFGASVVQWYPPFCAAVDITMGLIILFWWWPS
jgi:high-affinity Fe2+/Pb2+ permease